jgi:hypothetical protein
MEHSIKEMVFEKNVHLPKLLFLSEMKIIEEEKKEKLEPLKITNNSSPTYRFSRKKSHSFGTSSIV